MKNLYYNYLAMGEASMEWVVSAYVYNEKISVNEESSPEMRADAKEQNDTIEAKIMDESIFKLIPHAKVDSETFLKVLRAFAARRENDSTDPMPIDESFVRPIWEKLQVTPKHKESSEAEVKFETEFFVQQACDINILDAIIDKLPGVKEYMDCKLVTYSADAKKVLTLSFGLEGQPCMSIEEISKSFEDYSIFEIMKLRRDALLKLL